jgi:serine/threonine protein kinase
MGTVFKAMDRYRCDLPKDNRYVAIKFLHEDTGGRPEVLSNLRHEFYCAQALSHRSIVKVHELDRDEDVAFFTMELIEGELLSSALERSGPSSISGPHAWSIILEIADGLAHAHARNVVHGDLKPQNIMITNSGELRILDFGASHALAHRRSSADGARKTNLTPAYACCELLEGREADPRDDLYALACVTYELLAGEHPFQHRSSTAARDLGLVARRPPGLTRRQWQTLAMGLSWSREGRSISVREWVAKLHPGPAAAGRLARPLARYTERSYQLTAPSSRAIALLCVLLVTLAVWVSINRALFERNMSGDVTFPKAAANTLNRAMWPSAAPGGERPTLQAATFSAPVKGDAARTALHHGKLNKFSIAAVTNRIRSRDHFAEIHVHRSSRYNGDASFVWWTEPSSAKPGIDYVPQARVTQFLPKGSRLASLFIRIIPNVSRKHSAMFYVTIRAPSNGTTAGHLARTAILLPPAI